MLFKIEIKSNLPSLSTALGMRNILTAKSKILNYSFGASERLLDSYLRTTVKKGLVECCLNIITQLVKSTSTLNEIIYIIPDDYWDKIGQLITCGVGDIPGSRILIDSISHIYK
jgi:hypothetical protein